MINKLSLRQKNMSISVALILNKIVNFLFVASVLLFIDEIFKLGPTIIQATALSSILVAFISPFFYTLVANGYDQNSKTTVDMCLSAVYFILVVTFLLSLYFNSTSLLLLLLALSLFSRGICDPVIAVEGLIFLRSTVILCLVEPIRWSFFLAAETDDHLLIIVLLSLPVLTDMAIRYDKYLKLSKSSIVVFKNVITKVVRDKQLATGYKCIFACQSEQLLIFFWADTLSSAQSVAYIFVLQVVGFLMLVYLPYWITLLRSSVELTSTEKQQLMHKHTKFLYKTHIAIVVAIGTFVFGYYYSESIFTMVKLLMESLSFFDKFDNISIPIVLCLITSLTIFKSVFMDINLLATVHFFYRKVVITYSVFLFGLLVLFSGLVKGFEFLAFIVIYVFAYLIALMYEHLTIRLGIKRGV